MEILIGLIVAAAVAFGLIFYLRQTRPSQSEHEKQQEPPDQPEEVAEPDESQLEETEEVEHKDRPDREMPMGAPLETPDEVPYDVERVFFGTDRTIESEDVNRVDFDAGRANALTLGYADITIPRRHEMGKVERPKHYKLLGWTIYRQSEKLDRHFTIAKSERTDKATFLKMASDQASQAEHYKNSAFIFLHGFNVTFENALFRTAQLSYDLGFDGPTFVYSWPAQGKALSYVTDIDSAIHAAPHLDEYIDTVLQTPGIEKVHLVAHSMGNFALAELVRRVGTKVQARHGKFIDQLVLAAPDIDVDLFRDFARLFTQHAKNVTLYACGSDKALMLAREIRDDHWRAGDVPHTGPIVVDGIESIDITAVGSDPFSLNHSVYAEDHGLLKDLGLIMLQGLHPPDVRMSKFKAVEGIEGRYWVMPL